MDDLLAPRPGLPAAGPRLRYRHARTAGPGGRLARFAVRLAVVCLVPLAGLGGFAGARAGHVAWLTGGPRPALPDDAAAAPLAAPAPAPAGRGGYAMMERQDDGSGRPVRWDPCRPIHYVLDPTGSTPLGRAAVTAAIARVEQVTGLRFSYDGPTAERPRTDRPVLDGDRYGERWSPVLVAWADPAGYPSMTGFAGLGGPQSVGGERPGERRYVSGVVLLNGEHLAEIEHWDRGRDRVEAVVRHEFGHLVGLDHVDDPDELMFTRPTGVPADYAPGDLRGLAELSGGPCFRDY